MSKRKSADPQGNSSEKAVVPPSENLNQRPATPPPPPTLNDWGAKLWVEVWEGGGDAYWPHTDRHIIERYVLLRQEERSHLRALESGWTTLGSQGQEVPHPAAKFLMDTRTKLLQLEDRLGMNPGDRLRLGITAMEHKSKLEAFLEED